MSRINIKDFFLKLGFDSTDVTKGIKAVEKDLGKLDKHFKTQAKTRVSGEKKITSEKRTQAKLAAKELALDKARFSAKKKWQQAKASGADMSFMREEYNALRSKDIGRIKQAEQNLTEVIHDRQKVLAKEKAKQAAQDKKAQDRTRQASRNAVEDTKKLTRAKREAIRQLSVEQKVADAKRGLTTKINTRSRNFGVGAGSYDKSLSGDVARIKAQQSRLKKDIGAAKTSRDIKKLTDDMNKLIGAESTLAKRQARLNKEFRTGAFSAKALGDSMKNLARSHLSVFAAIGGATAAGNTGQNLVAVRATMLGASGDAKTAAEDWEFVKDTSFQLGQSLTEAGRGYAKIGTAAKASGMSQESAREMFLAASETATAFNLTADESQGVFRAFGQILAKGKLSSEELLQLGERIPAVYGPAAKSMNMTTQELQKQLELGKIQSVDFLPNYSKELRNLIRETGLLDAALQTSRTSMNRFGTAFELNILDAFDAGLEGGLSEFFQNLTHMVKNGAPFARSIGKIVGFILELSSTLMLMGQQFLRPFGMILEVLTGSSDKAGESVGTLSRMFHLLAAAILMPFAALEWLNNVMEETDSTLGKLGMALTTGAAAYGIAFMSSKILSFIGIIGTLNSVLSGMGLFNILTKGLKLVQAAIWAVTAAWSMSPMGRMAKLIGLGVTALAGAATYFGLTGDDEEEAKANATKVASTNASRSTSTAYNTGNNITIYSNDERHVAALVAEQVTGEFDYQISTNMGTP